MKILSAIFLLICSLSFSSCCDIFGIKYKENTSGGLRPKKNRFFKYKKISKENSQTYGLDFDHVYMRNYGEITSYSGEKIDSAFSFYRFFPTGEVLISGLYFYQPKKEEIDKVQQGGAGRYKVKGDLLKIEYIADHDCGSRVLEQARIEKGFIRVYKQNPRTFYGWIPKNSETDTFRIYNSVLLSNAIPDW